MDFNKVCPSCLRECMNEPMPAQCPHCGNNLQYENPAYALPARTILNGKYIVMRVNAETEQEISYVAYDLNLCIPIEIHEFFPRAEVQRAADSRNVEVRLLERFMKTKEKITQIRTLTRNYQNQNEAEIMEQIENISNEILEEL